ncbi:MAG: DUF4034 domain-containing protein [Candidatus Obscuribacterales bacterium]|nr:DUF4034 domain-containing protein [Candidatus Obscuribacterales bacterium]
MGSRNIVKLLIAISAGWLLLCTAIIGTLIFAEMHKPQWQKDADQAADQAESNPKRAIALYEKAITEAQNDNVPPGPRLDLMEKHADSLYSDGQYLEAKAGYHDAGALARRSRLLERQSDFLIYESRAWHDAYKLGLADMPDAAIVKTALALRSDKEELPNKAVQAAHLALADIAIDHEQYGKAVSFYKKALADASTLKDGDGKRDARLGMITVAVIQKNYRLGNDIFLEGVEDKDGDANTLRSNYFALMIEADASIDTDYDAIKANLLKLLQEQNFAKLDEFFAAELNKEKELPSGQLPVDIYLSYLNDLAASAPSTDWKNKIAALTTWNQKCPRSQAAKLVLADVLASYALSLKSQSESEEQKSSPPSVEAIFARAQRVLSEEKMKTPSWYNCSQTVVLNCSFDQQKYNKIVDECQRKFPNYKETVFSKAATLLPDAYGEDGDIEKYVADECRKLPAPQSDILYAQTVMYLETLATDDTLNVTSLSWDRTRRGLRSLLTLHKNWLVGKTLLSILATEAHDTKTAENAFAD